MSIGTKIAAAVRAFDLARAGNTDSARIAVRELATELQGGITKLGFEKIKASGSYGMGRVADVPWVACTHERFGHSASKGYFVVYLFSKDGKRVYLTIGVGAGTTQETPSKKSIEIITREAAVLRGRCAQLREQGFRLDGEIDLGSTSGRPKGYKAATAVYKEYSIENQPDEAQFIVDFQNALRCFSSLAESERERPNDGLPMSFGNMASAILAKPFMILTGNSGTGKTRLAESIASTFRNHDAVESASSLALVAVGADWTDNRAVVGFVNHLRQARLEDATTEQPVYQATAVLDLLLEADMNPTWPHFLILDEMNLSHVERYFADFLSAMEARNGVIRLHDEGPRDDPGFRLPRFEGDPVGVPREISYPPNLFVIGTVNVDETTYMFSPKVLDRAHVIEFQVDASDIGRFLDDPNELEAVPAAGEAMAKEFLQLALDARSGKLAPLEEPEKAASNKHLVNLLEILQRGRFEFAYRTANEVTRYLRVCRHLAEDKAEWCDGRLLSEEERIAGKRNWLSDLDDEILQKILPRLHGSRNRLGPLLGALASYLHAGDRKAADEYFPAEGAELAAKSIGDPECRAMGKAEALFPRSFSKIRMMSEILVEEQFVSFIC
jgi:5-methylcytosine-specific restriction protein B